MNNIIDYCQVEDIYLDLTCDSSKKNYPCIDYFIKKIKHHYSDKEIIDIKQSILEREKICSTAIGNFIAIPHCKTDVKIPSLRIFRFLEAIDFSSRDNSLVQLFFLMILPTSAKNKHLTILSKIVRLSKKIDWVNKLLHLKTKEKFYEELKKMDKQLTS